MSGFELPVTRRISGDCLFLTIKEAAMHNIKTYLIGLIFLSLAGCANEPDPSYVSPNLYQSYNCKQIKAERVRLSSKLNQASQTNQTGQVLDAAVNIFAISQGYGYSDENGREAEFRRLNNQYEVLDQTAIQKECDF